MTDICIIISTTKSFIIRSTKQQLTYACTYKGSRLAGTPFDLIVYFSLKVNKTVLMSLFPL